MIFAYKRTKAFCLLVACMGLSLSHAAGCGSVDSSSNYDICDGSSDLRLVYRSIGSGLLSSEGRLMSEHGHDFLMIDGECNYWSYEASGYMAPVVSGSLTAEQAAAISADLSVGDWDDYDDGHYQQPEHTHASRSSFWSPDSSFSCSGDCTRRFGNQDATEIRENARHWMQELNENGESNPQAFRLIVIEAIRDFHIDVPPAPAGFDPQLYLFGEDEYARYCEGDSRYVTGEAVVELARLREDFMNGVYGSGFPGMALEGEDGKIFEVFLRDALPQEGEDGLIRALNEDDDHCP
ncbi:hypothetical protein FRC96_08090 [Lujinxingia vulgaris]|uniref:Uncharacterized protein n=1 Tax=Lujinxingia vulgaris TaxID=2600176 RepID=A0A5C6XDQ3_9DELT|nr:hypothetical protein [Lujinxingia vulgaris]TXD37911.1 hypothetical protein FRC96_08090 [Lujinxingia vulgaris]